MSEQASSNTHILKMSSETKQADSKKDRSDVKQGNTNAEKGGQSSRKSSVEEVLYQLTNGLPIAEMRLAMEEASKCEAELLKDISVLEKALEAKEPVDETTLSILLESPLTPLDSYWTASALVGRLRDDSMAIPSILTITQPDNPLVTAATSKSSRSSSSSDPLDFTRHPKYSKKEESAAPLMDVWKKISAHRSSAVFKRAVKPEEAPGYAERINFPMDLGLIRKMIVARQIQSYADLHKYIGLISHNCVKYNGRETDYGRVAREFEAVSEEALRQAVFSVGTARSSSTTPTPVGSSSEAAATVPPKTTSAAAPSTANPAPTLTRPPSSAS